MDKIIIHKPLTKVSQPRILLLSANQLEEYKQQLEDIELAKAMARAKARKAAREFELEGIKEHQKAIRFAKLQAKKEIAEDEYFACEDKKIGLGNFNFLQPITNINEEDF